MTEAAPTLAVVPTRPPAPVRIKIPIRTVHEALKKVEGDRAKAAEALGVTRQWMNNRINTNLELRLEWAADRMALRQQMDESALDRLVRESADALSLNGQQILRQLRSLEERMRQAEKARELWSPDEAKTDEEKKNAAYVRKYSFRTNERGDPVEEEMVREAYGNLMEEFRLEAETAINTMHTKTKIAVLMKGLKGGDGRPPPGKLGFRSKASMIDEAQKGTIHVHAGKGSQVLVAQPQQKSLTDGNGH